jgi:hypothetical protein
MKKIKEDLPAEKVLLMLAGTIFMSAILISLAISSASSKISKSLDDFRYGLVSDALWRTNNRLEFIRSSIDNANRLEATQKQLLLKRAYDDPGSVIDKWPVYQNLSYKEELLDNIVLGLTEPKKERAGDGSLTITQKVAKKILSFLEQNGKTLKEKDL